MPIFRVKKETRAVVDPVAAEETVVRKEILEIKELPGRQSVTSLIKNRF